MHAYIFLQIAFSNFTDREMDMYVRARSEHKKLQNVQHFFTDDWSFLSCGYRKITEHFFEI